MWKAIEKHAGLLFETKELRDILLFWKLLIIS